MSNAGQDADYVWYLLEGGHVKYLMDRMLITDVTSWYPYTVIGGFFKSATLASGDLLASLHCILGRYLKARTTYVHVLKMARKGQVQIHISI